MNNLILETTETEHEKTLSVSQSQTLSETTPAERYYMNHKKNVARYQKANPEKCRIKVQKHKDKKRLEDPEAFQKKQFDYYHYYYENVRKPRNIANRKLKILAVANGNVGVSPTAAEAEVKTHE
jgi:hypothetical protein